MQRLSYSQDPGRHFAFGPSFQAIRVRSERWSARCKDLAFPLSNGYTILPNGRVCLGRMARKQILGPDLWCRLTRTPTAEMVGGTTSYLATPPLFKTQRFSAADPRGGGLLHFRHRKTPPSFRGAKIQIFPKITILGVQKPKKFPRRASRAAFSLISMVFHENPEKNSAAR